MSIMHNSVVVRKKVTYCIREPELSHRAGQRPLYSHTNYYCWLYMDDWQYCRRNKLISFTVSHGKYTYEGWLIRVFKALLWAHTHTTAVSRVSAARPFWRSSRQSHMLIHLNLFLFRLWFVPVLSSNIFTIARPLLVIITRFLYNSSSNYIHFWQTENLYSNKHVYIIQAYDHCIYSYYIINSFVFGYNTNVWIQHAC